MLQSHNVLLLAGWQNSGPQHWHSRWEALHGFRRVEQHDWDRPLRGDWMMQLEETVLATSGPLWLAAHSLGCILTAAWAEHSGYAHRIAGALLVAPGDTESLDLRTKLPSWAPIVRKPLPFPSILLGSENDPFCALHRAQEFAAAWGSRFINYGARGHINSASGLGDWEEGLQLLQQLMPPQTSSATETNTSTEE